MLKIFGIIERNGINNIEKACLCIRYSSTDSSAEKRDEFRILNIRKPKGRFQERKQPRTLNILPPRSESMPADQDWGNVWPGPRSFHPATVPLPIRQGYVEKGGAPPDKFANAELVKIPNFLHLTPPVIERQCQALRRFCAPWPKNLDRDETLEKRFPLEITSSDYCFSSPSVRNPLARIVTVRFKLDRLGLGDKARDKFLRLVGDRYDEDSDTVTIVTDRCPLKKQNYDYAMYLITALYHESYNVEEWENSKTEADMEYYDWSKNKSKENIEKLFGKSHGDIENADKYADSVDKLMNEGENPYTLEKYGETVRKLLNLPQKIEIK